MKLVRLSTVYPDYQKQFYGHRPGLELESYATQEEALLYDAFGWADFWKNAMAPLGYNVFEIIANVEPLQRAWARENNRRQPGGDWFHRLAADRIQVLRPDVLFINDYVSFDRSWIEEIRTRCPSIRLVLGWCGAPFPDAEVFKGYDAVLSCASELVDMFRQMGHESYHLNHAFDRRILDRIAGTQKVPYDFTFVGQINRQSGFHREREKTLLQLVDRTPLTIFSMNSHTGPGKYLMAFLRKSVYSFHSGLSSLGISEKLLGRIPIISRGPKYHDHPLLPVHLMLKKHLLPPVFGLDMFRVLSGSKITFNNHVNISLRSSCNMRMFESTGVGTCLLTDHMENTSDLFEPDSEVVTYRSAEECVDKALYLLGHPAEREKIANAAQSRTLRDHSFDVRAQKLDGIIRERLEKK